MGMAAFCSLNDCLISRLRLRSSAHTDIIEFTTSRTGPPGSRGAASSSACRDSKVSMDTQGASSGTDNKGLVAPVAITASGRDSTVPPQSVVRLANALKTRGRDVLLIFREKTGHSTSYTDARAILEFVLQKARPKN